MSSAADPALKRAILDAAETVATTNTTMLKQSLLRISRDEMSTKGALEYITLDFCSFLTNDLQYLRTLRPQQSQQSTTNSGLKLYSLKDCHDKKGIESGGIYQIFLNFRMRKSQLFYEREHYDALYQQILELWKMPEHIILTGNSGIGTSFFLIYMLRRLLNETEKTYRFVVHQLGSSCFLLFDLVTCQAWQLEGHNWHIVALLNSLENALYFFEPGTGNTNQSPFTTPSRAISFLPPRLRRIGSYARQTGKPFQVFCICLSGRWMNYWSLLK
jgi:hypothetical protein